jgi:DNA-binding NtrC family response regulator
MVLALPFAARMEPLCVLSSEEPPLGRTVLVVDDDEATCHLLADWIQHLGFHVMTALDAQQALTLMRAHPADVAFCDIVMPGRDGVWLIDQLQRHFPRTAVVIATGLTKMDPAVRLAPSVTAYLVKPFNFDEVAGALGSAFAAIAAE